MPPLSSNFRKKIVGLQQDAVASWALAHLLDRAKRKQFLITNALPPGIRWPYEQKLPVYDNQWHKQL
jgi:hypothetical protein